jgi:hypothetical protein
LVFDSKSTLVFPLQQEIPLTLPSPEVKTLKSNRSPLGLRLESILPPPFFIARFGLLPFKQTREAIRVSQFVQAKMFQ